MQLGVIPADASQALNYGIDRARFLTPVTSGQRIRAHVTLAGAEQKAAASCCGSPARWRSKASPSPRLSQIC